MSQSSTSLESFQFTFESILDAKQIEADSDPSRPATFDSQSLTDSISAFRVQFGRTYHAYRAGSYQFPNDATETQRLDEQYEILKEVMDGRIYLAPFDRQNPPRKVLDIATGTGTWAVDFGDEYPEAIVIGTDLSPIQPAFVPPNVSFFVEDSTEDWDYNTNFDYIHTRLTLGCWRDMKTQIIQRAFDHLEPGGWLECQEINVVPCCDDGTMPDDFGWSVWAREMTRASELANRQLDLGEQVKVWLHEVGFVDIHEAIIKIPVGSWPKDQRLKHLGMLWQQNLLSGLQGFTMALAHNVLGKTIEEIEVSLVKTRQSIFDPKVHSYHSFHVVWGQKPQ